jgi:hypothetical protein
MIREILEKNEYTDWYIVQPDKHNPDTSNAKCVLFNFVGQKRAALIIPNEWFQRYRRIVKLISLVVQHSTPIATDHTYSLSFQDSLPKELTTKIRTESCG